MKSNKFLMLHSNCKIVRGVRRSCIYDLQRGTYYLIPNAMADLFKGNKKFIEIEPIAGELDSYEINIFNEYIDFLCTKELAIYVPDISVAEMFPDISKEWDFPALVSHFIIDYDLQSNHDIDYIINSILIPANCRYVQFRFFRVLSAHDLGVLMHTINESFIKSIDIVAQIEHAEIAEITEVIKNNKKIRSFLMHNYKDEIISDGNYGYGIITSLSQEIKNESHCGFISPSYFSVNLETYFESLNFNSCLNRKMSIDSKGRVKNCPAMPNSFGNYKEIAISNLLSEDSNFRKYWTIKKDSINKCNVCEFRYMCTDCRAFIDNPSDIFSPPLKCGYDPHTGHWDEWSKKTINEGQVYSFGGYDSDN